MNGQFLSAARRMLAPLSLKIKLLVSRGVVELVNDSLKCQGLQVSLLADESQDDIERFEDYGMTSHPFVGAEVLFISVGGVRSHGVVARVLDRRYRPTDMGEGDVCLYTDKGERVYIDSTGDVVNLGAKAAADFVALAADVKARLDTIQSTFDAHTHVTTATIGASGTPGVISPPSSPIGALASVAATKVKAT